jgi:hypothetical protein
MARLSDFQTAPVARNLAAEQLVEAHSRKVHRGIVDYRSTRIEVKPGAVACFGRDAVKAVTERQHAHSALDAMMSRLNMTENDAPRLHAALDRLLDGGGSKTQSQILGDLLGEPETQNRVLHEPDEPGGDSDEEPEEGDDDGEENEEPHAKVKIPYDSLSLDELQRSLDKTFGADDGAALSRVMVMDSANDLRLGNPDDNAMDAIAKLPIRFDVNTRARQPWFAALRNWIGRQPMNTTVKDLHQGALHKLLHELQTAA